MSSVERQSKAKPGLSERLKALRPDLGRPRRPDPSRPDRGPAWQNAIYALIAIFALSTAMSLLRSPVPEELSYTELKQAVRDGRVAQVTFEGEQVSGRFVESEDSQAPQRTEGGPDVGTAGETTGSSGETQEKSQTSSETAVESEAETGTGTGTGDWDWDWELKVMPRRKPAASTASR